MIALEQLKYPIGKFDPMAFSSYNNLDKAIEDIASLPAKFSGAILSLSEKQLNTPYRPGGWTVRQLAHHVVDSHINAYVRLKIALTEKDPTIRPYEEAEWAKLDDTAITPVKVSLEILALLHERWVNLISSLDSAQLKKKYYHPADKEWVSVKIMIGMYAWHGNHHLAHVMELVKREGW
ncbi:MAG: YfiT family bacillithiol transferase [Bacteroidota bacterium]